MGFRHTEMGQLIGGSCHYLGLSTKTFCVLRAMAAAVIHGWAAEFSIEETGAGAHHHIVIRLLGQIYSRGTMTIVKKIMVPAT